MSRCKHDFWMATELREILTLKDGRITLQKVTVGPIHLARAVWRWQRPFEVALGADIVLGSLQAQFIPGPLTSLLIRILQDFSIETENLCLSVHLSNTVRASWAVDLSFAPVDSDNGNKIKESGLPAIRSCQLSERISLATKFQNREPAQDPCVQPCRCGQKKLGIGRFAWVLLCFEEYPSRSRSCWRGSQEHLCYCEWMSVKGGRMSPGCLRR
ncbi:hypothetical protein AVEN_221716-1 [Araneus ventricosus]|uniref:Uncharacterized protein n=1 Tax=Araneus ventricosus TaxID=182803 RepID=A0A4Y2X3M9_ARAVE|nr:hypothetical protein AVEN_221716-1 [Araneus ventricosus]